MISVAKTARKAQSIRFNIFAFNHDCQRNELNEFSLAIIFGPDAQETASVDYFNKILLHWKTGTFFTIVW